MGSFLEDAGKLIQIKEEVDSRFEISAVLKRVGQAGGLAVTLLRFCFGSILTGERG
jgi:3-polyprenyl-4-hydroxybenzoate decarboxylase